jgi:hypothetical protein
MLPSTTRLLFKRYLNFFFHFFVTGQRVTCTIHDISVHMLPIRYSKGGKSTQCVAISMCFLDTFLMEPGGHRASIVCMHD